MLSLCILAFLLPFTAAEREYLPEGRIPEWKARNNPNWGPTYSQPEQVHLSYGGDPTKMYVTWLTFNDTIDAIVEYGVDDLNITTKGNITKFVDGGAAQKVRYISRVLLEELVPGTTYSYHVGSPLGWSSIFRFKTLSPREEGGYIYAVYGDMGNENARSLGQLQRQAQFGQVDMVLHVGDIAYQLEYNDGDIGDEFMRQIESIGATVPYMTVVGNHENVYNFSHYVNRYTMPGTDNNHFYSYDLGDVHFIAFSTEFYFFTGYGQEQILTQWNWLIDDLTKANANRKNVPWIIAMGHRPMYCDDNDTDDCRNSESVVRTGMQGTHAFALEPLFYKYGVDLLIFAHEHSYERLYAVYNRTVYNGTDAPYVNPPAPVHVITGAAGCCGGTDTFIPKTDPWSVVRSSNYGFSKMHVFNATHLHFEQIQAATDKIEDSFWLVKTRHGPYNHKDRQRLKAYGTRVPLDVCAGGKCKPHGRYFNRETQTDEF